MKSSVKSIISILLAAVMLTAVCSCAKKADSSRIDGFAMDTTVSVTVYGDRASDLAAAALRETTALENALSWSIPTSEAARINAAAGKPVLAPQAAAILNAALPLTDDTDGEFSLSLRRLCALWGIGSDNARVPTADEIAATLADCDTSVTVSGDEVTLSNKSAELDFGAVGKGAACDKIADLLSERKATAAVAAVGGSILCYGKKPNGDWNIAVAVPGAVNTALGTLTFSGTAFVSTSGSEERFFIADGVKYHHIFSGITGYPAKTGLTSVTVAANSGILSDALATACFLLGYDRSLPLLEKYGANAVFVTDDMTVRVTDGLKNSFLLSNTKYTLIR